MAGIKGRSGRIGRFKRNIEELIDDNRLRASALVNLYLKNESIPIEEKIPHAMAIVLKIMPNKQEVLSLTMSLSDETAKRLLDLAERNMLMQKELELESNRRLGNVHNMSTGIELESSVDSSEVEGDGKVV